ncbi:MAG: molybdopterin molybdotransferase MoeA [Planctomycetes bacterium]|nr:molybdopterin molybdotransferase MoeA [Planctomycetota bacterium]
MLPVAEAQRLVFERVKPLAARPMPLSDAALGLVLGEDIASDIDAPPFDKSMMDGYAIRSDDLAEGKATLAVIEEVSAGRTATRAVSQGQAIRIMTGAPIPAGADAVVPVERTKELPGNVVLLESKVTPGQHILPRGQEMTQGQAVLSRGCRLRPQELGLLAAVGRTAALVHPAPMVTVLPTGDEIVEPPQAPGPAQIRNSNGPMLAAQVRRAGGVPKPLGIARDQVEHLRTLIGEGLRGDVLILSGGVSAGKLDLVPGVLAELGVEPVFHKIEMKPGKPLFFGTRGPTLVFGLPGNPVSSLVCFELFVRPAIERLLALPQPGPHWLQASLQADFPYRTDRPTYHPACLWSEGPVWQVRIVPWGGSPDLRGLTVANAFALLPAGDHVHKADATLAVLKVE